MAVLFTLVAASPNQLRYKMTSTGAQSGELTAAVMGADAVPGSKLEAFLLDSYSGVPAAVAATRGPDLDVAIVMGADVAAAKSWGVIADVDTNALKFVCTSEAADASGSYLTITYRHTATR